MARPWYPRWVQLPRRRAYTGRRLEVRECLDGRLLVFADGQGVATQLAPATAFSLRPRHGPRVERNQRDRAAASRAAAEDGAPAALGPRPPASRPAAARTPSPAHPWRHSTPYSTRSRGMTFSRNS